MLDRFSSYELEELHASEVLDPPVEIRVDAGLALVQRLLIQLAGNRSPPDLDQLVPRYGPSDPRELERDVISALARAEQQLKRKRGRGS